MNLVSELASVLGVRPFASVGAFLALATYGAVRSGNRARRVVATVFGVLASTICLVLQFSARDHWWLWAASFVSPCMIAFQGLHVAVFKNRGFLQDGGRATTGAEASLRPLIRAAGEQEERYYTSAALTLRYGVPALVLAGANLSVGYALLEPKAFFIDPNIAGLGAARYGALGAYLYTLLYLGNRTFRSDVTTGAAIWSTVTMASGPVFAGVLDAAFKGGPTGGEWTAHLLPFAAGFSPRYITVFVEAAIRKFFGGPTTNTSQAMPLMRVRGINRDIEERLAEEGITDVAGLAMANPLRLRRNTSFDRRQLTAWIDEAILLTFLPQAAQSLIADGITGAIDLIWYASNRKLGSGVPAETNTDSPPEDHGPDPDQPPAAVKQLAQRNKLDEMALWETILRLKEDAQVRLVWATYQLADSESESADTPDSFRSFVPENLALKNRLPGLALVGGSDLGAPWQERREEAYKRTRGLFLVDASRASSRPGQVADIVIRLYQRGRGPMADGKVAKVEYYLGPKFFRAPIAKTDPGDAFALSVSAYGPFLCVARVTFNDGTDPLDLERYVYVPPATSVAAVG